MSEIKRLSCPNCGCDHFEGAPSDDWKTCRNCGRRVRVPVVKLAVDFVVVACPYCSSDDTRVTSTTRPIRYHKCGKCGSKFKSIERVLQNL